ncbi:MAG: uracil phosphoribosyltransferase [Firmicutes bacterium HGW-Firmicutes-9]|jgi:uracil phosphoribosyltransferase|nr:MAG: uracil phosphoribosyltransferase [Firmicutes bacterium HGW-Firmicutes-9]
MAKVITIDHPLVQHKLSLLRDKDTGCKAFRELVYELAMLMAYEVTRDLELKEIEIETPICKTTVQTLANEKIAVIPILRAGLGMADGIMSLIPNAKVGHIGLYRNPDTLMPTGYYCKLPQDIAERETIIVDPMLATGNSGIEAIHILKENKVNSIRFVSLIAAPEGIAAMQAAHPDVDIYVAHIDEKLNEHGYIVPGLGDAGDRLFGTK